MAIASRLLGSGISALAAQNIVGDAETAATAAGSSQATAYQMYAAVTNFTTVAASAGALVPAGMNPGDSISVYNAGSNTLSVYGQTGESINNGSANAAYSVAANKGAIITKKSSTTYMAVLTA